MTARMPYALQRRGGTLLNQQCWVWGQDVRRPEGNLLVEHGFHRVPLPAGLEGCSQYSLPLEGGGEVRLWGFGIFYRAAPGTGLYLNRFSFAPLQVVLDSDIWKADAFAGLPASQDFAAVAAAVRWIEQFEREIQLQMGAAYRSFCLRGCSKRTLPGPELLTAWQVLAGDLEAFAGKPHRVLSPSSHRLQAEPRVVAVS